jgi:isoaspartyl peptidase/L-asparaginase-like protein (Ntn-hydrolase superfamily)
MPHLAHSLLAYGVVLLGLSLNMTSTAIAQAKKEFAIVIHGGAGGDPSKWTEEYRQQRLDALSAALERGVELLSSGAEAMDVVEQVVRNMEDNEVFNAGRGCGLTEQGEHELDASIMDGRDLSCGAVAGVRHARNPISLARKVMSDTKHILLMGTGADEFAEAAGVELAEDSYFRTPRQLANWERWKNKQVDVSLHVPSTILPGDKPLYLGTVGCAVLDKHGNLAAGTSTGGLMGKQWGRVGDSPIIGAGNYADNATCAVSGTGVGEEFIRHNVAADIAARMRYAGKSLQEATQAVVSKLPENCGGVIAVDGHGNVMAEFNTPGMSHAFADSSGEKSVRLAREN